MSDAKGIHAADQSIAAARNFGGMVAAFMGEVKPQCTTTEDQVYLAGEYIRSYWRALSVMRRNSEEGK